MIGTDSKQTTNEAFADPQVGDVFHEMCSFWVVVVYVDEDHVVVVTVDAGGRWSVRGFETHDDYRAAYAYRTIDGYWVRLDRRGVDVAGWFNPTSERAAI